LNEDNWMVYTGPKGGARDCKREREKERERERQREKRERERARERERERERVVVILDRLEFANRFFCPPVSGPLLGFGQEAKNGLGIGPKGSVALEV
jgi:hypothetical protein